MVLRNLHEHDLYAVGVADPHLDQAPRLVARLADDRYARSEESLVFGNDVTDLQPQLEVRRRRLPRSRSGHLQEGAAEEEDHTSAELPVDRKTQGLSIEAQ